jgi:hypothetical protein
VPKQEAEGQELETHSCSFKLAFRAYLDLRSVSNRSTKNIRI